MHFNHLFLSFATIALLTFSACGHDDTADEEPAYTLTADQIVNEFLDDAAAANQKFNDQIVQVSGTVMELNKENGMITGVKLSEDEFNIVNCTFQHPMESHKVAGNTLTVKGVCSGFLGDASSMLPGGTVELKRAAVVE